MTQEEIMEELAGSYEEFTQEPPQQESAQDQAQRDNVVRLMTAFYALQHEVDLPGGHTLDDEWWTTPHGRALAMEHIELAVLEMEHSTGESLDELAQRLVYQNKLIEDYFLED